MIVPPAVSKDPQLKLLRFPRPMKSHAGAGEGSAHDVTIKGRCRRSVAVCPQPYRGSLQGLGHGRQPCMPPGSPRNLALQLLTPLGSSLVLARRFALLASPRATRALICRCEAFRWMRNVSLS